MTGARALAFDVFGTVVDWRSTIIREGEALGREKGLDVDWAAFADAWRARYAPSMNRVRSGEVPWTNLDALHRHPWRPAARIRLPGRSPTPKRTTSTASGTAWSPGPTAYPA